MEVIEEDCKSWERKKSNEVVDYYSTISAQETKTNKQNNLLTLTISCEKSCLIRRRKKNK